ncbi:COP23 domain-containing protein [Geminocystis sp. NIES-3709]|uniref:COP23 domain-containing protein n=1 Tax=Geminocystis sp. NIES-3709 TaxID=1617448 RepID=UPI0005FC8FBF|nr:COP23 domain-containing protein [Geminocystis sp. NIES-3709]BAQ64014.1 hypothetical protein GM3709_779 [Geminocystis sp. NIES-3709]
MNIHFINRLLIFSGLFWVGITNTIQAQGAKNTYKCINNQGIPTTIVDTPRGRIQLITWQSEFFRNSGWTPQKRCQEVTTRFQKFSDSGKLKFVTTGVQKNLPVICVGQKFPGKGYTCIKDGLLITLQSSDNSNEILKSLFSNAARVGGTPVSRDPEGKFVVPIDDFLQTAEVTENTDNPKEGEVLNSNPNPIPSSETKEETKEMNVCPSILCN